MATIKSFTSLEQSKKLAEILPPESADMWHHGFFTPSRMCKIEYNPPAPYHSVTPQWDCPCWSLSALLEEIPEVINFEDDESDYELKIEIEGGLYWLSYGNILEYGKVKIKPQENFVDACYEMILMLHELKML